MMIDGKDLKIGDTIKVWWSPKRDTILSLEPYEGPLECLDGARVAHFAILETGMTIPADESYELINRP